MIIGDIKKNMIEDLGYFNVGQAVGYVKLKLIDNGTRAKRLLYDVKADQVHAQLIQPKTMA